MDKMHATTILAVRHKNGVAIGGDGQVLKVERDGLPTDAEIELLVQHAGTVRGLFLLTAAARITRPDLEQRLVAVALADQVGAALSSQEPLYPHL